MVEPIKPDEVQDLKDLDLPDEVLDVFNKLIVKGWNSDSKSSKVDAKEAATMIAKALALEYRKIVYDMNLMNIEPRYKKSGWKVEYNSPDRGDNFKAYYIFSF